MQPDLSPKSKTLLGITELTLVANLKDDLIPALDARSYVSRAALVMKTLNTLRHSSREAEPTPLIQDAVDRIRAIHSFRLSILGTPPRQLMLSVTFDGGWEAYMRQIWRDLGPLLDLLFCHCEDYLTSHDHSYADYIGWVRRVQVNTDFFYTAGAQTVNDLRYLRKRETVRIDGEARAEAANFDALWQAQALPAITALYRLSDMFPRWLPEESGLLTRATRRLLGEEVFEAAVTFIGGTTTEKQALDWFREIKPLVRKPEPLVNPSVQDVQAGILESYDRITHGCLLLVALDDAAAARDLLAYAKGEVLGATAQAARGRGPFLNLAFTYPGLALAGLPEGDLQQLPLEFREGMAARAGVLGDWRHNHPLHWRLPRRNGSLKRPDGPEEAPVELSAVHVVLQLQGSYPTLAWGGDPLTEPAHPLALALKRLIDALEPQGAHVLSVQPMQRLTPHPDLAQGHFGYVDGISQPMLGNEARIRYSDQVPAGDLLLGFTNSLNDPPLTGPLWSHSSFLVVRKLRQDVPAFEAALAEASTRDAAAPAVGDAKAWVMGRGLDGHRLDAPAFRDNDFTYDADRAGAVCPFQSHVRRVNPRTPDSLALDSTPTATGVRDDQKKVPRILRRGMSYGPKYDGNNGDVERGLMFMAYNASIAEQFEVLQAWLAGGNSGSRDTWSGQRDPFMGVPLDDEPLDFVFTPGVGPKLRVRRDPARPWVSLEWGLYLFVPSLPAIGELERHATTAAKTEAARNNKAAPPKDKQYLEDQQNARIGGLSARGAVVIRGLQQAERALGFDAAKTQWKMALEDIGARTTGTTQAIWTAIREQHGGVLRTPYGVLVGSKEKVMELFTNTAKNLTATGYLARMNKSFGAIYLGLDDDGPAGEYQRLSPLTNAAIHDVSRDEAYQSAFRHTVEAVQEFANPPGSQEEISLEVKDLVDRVLGRLSREYFGVPDDVHVTEGGWHGRPPTEAQCPAHFHAPSRYMFQPQPSETVQKVAEAHGTLLRAAVKRFVAVARAPGAVTTPIAQAVLRSTTCGDEAARILIGALMGFLPTVDGNLRAVLYEWVNDRSLWDHQSALIVAAAAAADAAAAAAAGAAVPAPAPADTLRPPLHTVEEVLLDPLAQTMQLRPVPELTWRRVSKAHDLGDVKVQPGETVVVGIVSAVHEDLLKDKRLPDGDPTGHRDLSPVFGGVRNGSPGTPTHACPGYEMAMGVLLGTLAGLMLSARLRPTLSPVTLRLLRRTPAPVPPAPAKSAPPSPRPSPTTAAHGHSPHDRPPHGGPQHTPPAP